MKHTGALEQIKPIKKEAVKSVHHYKIISPDESKAKKIFYRTNVITEEGKRLPVRSTTLEEMPLMFDMLNKEILAYEDCTDMYGIFLLFTKGLRIAELASLKLCDIDFKTKQLYVHRMETILEDENEQPYMTVVDYEKKISEYAIRWLDLTDREIELIKKVVAINTKYGYEDDDFLFLDSDGRTKIRAFGNRIRKMCKKIGMEEKSAHDIRRTVASKMFYDNFTLDYIQVYLGHSDPS